MITKDSPETTNLREVSRSALVRTAIRFNITRDMEEASQMLGVALYKSWIRNHPMGLKMIAEKYGEQALHRAQAYCEVAGFPAGPLKIPRMSASGDQRRTPPEVRALWGICDQAVGEVLMGLGENSRKALTLNLSWGLHNAAYVGYAPYREEIEEVRRIRRTDRYSASWAIVLLPFFSLVA